MKLIHKKRVTKTEIVFLFLGLLYVFPIYLLIVNSFKTYGDIIKDPYFLPSSLYFGNFGKVFGETYFLEGLKNTLISTVVSVAVLVLLSSMSGYALIRRKGKINNYVYLFFVAGVLIPFQTYMIPIVKEFQIMGLLRTPISLIITYVAQYTPLSIFIYAGFMKSIPYEMEEAAVIDGCGPYKTFFTIIFPLIKACTSTIIIFFSISIWNAFVQPITILGTVKWKILFVQIYSFISDKYFQQWNLTFTACFMSLIPILVLYVIMQSRIISGITNGSVKG